MASWTDVRPPQFNPYRQQLPVDAMTSVGLQKQAQYEEGIERIQSEIDHVAGMDVVRDIDRRYLQSKVNEIGNNTKFAAASDFSNSQLVKSLAGMVNHIAKDKNIVNAVSSTAKYRNEVSRMEKAREEGKSSIANEAYFGYKANDWLSSQDLNRGFDAQYMENIDVDKKWMEVLKSLHSDLDEQDVPYVQNPDGSIDYMQTAAAMQRRSSERVSSSKIENALRASLTPDELQQLNINGWYQFRDATPQQLAMQSKIKFDKTIQTNLDRIRELEGLSNFTDDPQLKMNATNSIASLRSMNVSLQKDYNDEIQWVQQNPDLAKGLIYKNGAIAQFAQAHSWEHTKSNLLSNPVLQAQFEQERINLSRAEFQLSQQKFTWDQMVDKENLNLRQQELLLEQGKANPTIPFHTYLGTSTNVPSPLTAANDEVNMLIDQESALRQQILSNSDITKEQLDNAILKYKNGDENSRREADEFIGAHLQGAINELIAIERKRNIITKGIEQTKNQVLNSPKYKEAEQNYRNELSELGQIALALPNGQRLNYTEDEIIDFLDKVDVQASKVSYSPFGFAAGVENTKVGKAITELTDKEALLYNNMNGNLRGMLSRYATKKKTFEGELNQDVQKAYAEKIQSFVPMSFSVETPKPEDRNRWEVLTGTILSRYNDPLGGTRGGAEQVNPDDIETVKSWLVNSDKSNLQYQPIIIPGSGKTFLNVIKGTEEVVIPLTAIEASQLPINTGNALSSQTIDVYNAQAIGRGNTNPTGNFNDSYFDRTLIPNTTLNIKGDIQWDLNNPNRQFVKLNLRTPQGDIPLTLGKFPMQRDQAIGFIQSLTDKQIVDLYMQNPAVSPDQKRIIQGLIQKQ